VNTFLILYATGEGQTAEIAGRIATTISERGHEARVIDVRDRPDWARSTGISHTPRRTRRTVLVAGFE